MPRAFEDSSLWRTAFGPRTKDKHADQRKFLEIAYRQFREAVLPLLRQTAIDLPALTVHDETHVDQLWDVASEICGTDYPLNPLEAFVVGGAFLLHDSALCIAAYENSLEGLMRTDEWQDSVARLWRIRGIDKPDEHQKLLLPEDLKNSALFDVLRRKHSQQASILIDRTWKHPVNERPILLLENAQLQEDYGKLIGQIAASHHWPIKLVEKSFPTIIPASTSWPREWEIDPLKLACILRCADAAAIDDRRAPSRLFAFRVPTDTSRRHWAFQNNLYPASLQQETLVFISKTPFELKSMEDWWLCFDAVNIVDEELRASNASLAAHNRPPFAARQAFGAKVAEDFSKKVAVKGWTPVETSLRVSDIPKIIERFGGTKLYGDDAQALFRELIQNGADAIRARRRRDVVFKNSVKYAGQITIGMKLIDDGKTIEIAFEDDGIGMPASVLTGPLLDFGTSFWETELAAILYPGLQSDTEFRPAGKYGIGFFSAFMFSEYVTVVSRPFSKGNDDRLALVFKDGLNRRAQLRPYDLMLDGQVGEHATTTVTVRVPIERLFNSLTPRVWRRSKEVQDLGALYRLTRSFLSQLCFALDILVRFRLLDGTLAEVNKPFYADWTSKQFIHDLVKIFADGKSPSPNLATCVEPIVNDDGKFCGRACIALSRTPRASIRTIDGFARIRDGYYSHDFYNGVLEQIPTVASRDAGTYVATRSAWNRWALKQLSHIVENQENFSSGELYFAATRLSQFELDVLPIAHCCLVDTIVPLEECVEVFKKTKKMTFLIQEVLSYGDTEEPKSYKLGDVAGSCRAISEDLGNLIEPESFIQSYAGESLGIGFESISDDPSNSTEQNILSYFLRLLSSKRIPYSVSLEKAPIGRYSGFDTNWITNDEIVEADAVVVSLRAS